MRPRTPLQGLPIESTVDVDDSGVTRAGRRIRSFIDHREQTAHLQTALLHSLIGAGPDTNRSAGLHSFSVVAYFSDPDGNP